MNFSGGNIAAVWKKWKQSMQLYEYIDAVMSSKTEKEKYSTFLFLIGEVGREIFNTWAWPKIKDEAGNKTDEDQIPVTELFRKFEEYCIPKRNLIIERRKFFKRDQRIDENIDSYVIELKNLALTCEFGEIRESMMTFRIVEGIKSDAVRDRLLRQGADLSFAQAVDICRAEEITLEKMKSLTEHTSDVGSVLKKAVSKSKQDKGNIYKKYDQNHRTHSCIFCGRQHPPKKCPAYGTVCRNCNKKNHWSKCCKLRKEVKEISIDDDAFVIETVAYNDEKQCNTEATVVLHIKDAKVRMKIDTGAEVNVMPLRVFNQVNDRSKESILTLKSTSTKLTGYGGNKIPVCGVCLANCSFQGKILHTDFYVIETDSRSVLGLDSCKKLDLIQVMCAVHKKPAKIAGTESSKLQEQKTIKVETANKIKQLSNKFDEDMKREIKQMYPEVLMDLVIWNQPIICRLKSMPCQLFMHLGKFQQLCEIS